MAERLPSITHRGRASSSLSSEGKVADEAVKEEWNDETIADVTGAQFDDPNLDKDNLVGFEDDSPYPEVRSAVANTDDPDMPVNTLRAWIIGIIWAMIIPGANQFFFFRYPSVTITGIVAQLLSYPLGRAAAAFLPRKTIFGISLNPGPFSVKEHVLITIMATVGYQSAYATDIIAVQRVFYGQIYNFSYQWFVVMSTQLIGFSIGGVARRFLVTPPSMIWPLSLVNCALFNTLHSTQYSGMGQRKGISRERFFVYAFLGSFAWYFFPGYIFQALSYFSWVTWIKPESPSESRQYDDVAQEAKRYFQHQAVAALFGYVHGMGMSVITFDWSQIAYINSPLASPWWAEANVFAGFIFFFWFLTPILYFTNTFNTAYFPISSRTSYDNQLKPYNVTRILNDDATFNAEAYHAYSPLFISTTFTLTYGISFAGVTSTLVHAFLYYRKQIWTQARRSIGEHPDVHARLMARYPQVPEWWYLSIFLVTFAIGVISIEVWHTQMPVWAFVFALVIAFIYVIPVGIIQAITNQQVGLNVITELIIGYVLPGRPIAMMMFKTWGYITMAQALSFINDFKLGHYMKVPPRAMFWAQILATIIAGTTQLGVQSWMFTNIKGMCEPDQKDGFICPSTQVFGTASIIVLLGLACNSRKARTFTLVFFFLIGAIAPVIPWLLSKRWPNSFIKYINFPVIFSGVGNIPPATAINYVPWAAVGFVFQYVIRRRHLSWWTKYNYVLSAALDSGVAISIIFIFFALQYPKNGEIGATTLAKWWGNTVFLNGADGAGTALKQLEPGQKIGPTSW